MVEAQPNALAAAPVGQVVRQLSPVRQMVVAESAVAEREVPCPFVNNKLARVEVPEAEFDSMGCNVLALSPRVCLMVKGNPITKARLEKAGCKVIEYEGAEISVKGGGGPTCLTRPVERL